MLLSFRVLDLRAGGHGAEMLHHELELPVLEVRDGGAVAPDAGSGDDPALDAVGGAPDVGDVGHAVGAGHRVAEQLVALGPYDLVDGLPERLLARPVHPYDGVGGVMDDYDVVYDIQDHVHELLSVDLRLFHFYP